MSYRLCLHTTYDTVEVGLIFEYEVREMRSLVKEKASSLLMVTISQLLKDNKKKLSDISSIIVNQGPAPFTTLRTIITTANGIAFATGIPLVGIDSLRAFLCACAQEYDLPIIVMLNAFNKAVYYGIKSSDDACVETGYAQVQEFIKTVQARYNLPINFFGNGALLYRDDLHEGLGERLVMPQPFKLVPSMADLVIYYSNNVFNQKNLSSLEPLYLKKSI